MAEIDLDGRLRIDVIGDTRNVDTLHDVVTPVLIDLNHSRRYCKSKKGNRNALLLAAGRLRSDISAV